MSGVCFPPRTHHGLYAHACFGIAVFHGSPGNQECASVQPTTPRLPDGGESLFGFSKARASIDNVKQTRFKKCESSVGFSREHLGETSWSREEEHQNSTHIPHRVRYRSQATSVESNRRPSLLSNRHTTFECLITGDFVQEHLVVFDGLIHVLLTFIFIDRETRSNATFHAF